MKSEHRHELKTNELAEWLSNFPQWAKENLKTIIYVSIVSVLVIASAAFHWYKKNVESVQKQLELTRLISQLSQGKAQILQARLQGIDASYMLLRATENLQSFAKNSKDDQMAAFALIKQAETLRTELHYRFGSVDERDVIAQINLAKASYNEAIERLPKADSPAFGSQKSSSNPSLMAAAKFGLGLCEEELGNFATAENIYRDITANADFEGTAAAAQAKHRLETMGDYQRKVAFKAAPKRAPTAPLQPQIELKVPEAPQRQDDVFEVADSNLPGQ